MRNIILFESMAHKFILLNESEPGEEDGIRSNQYLVVHGEDAVLLDPGGFGVMPRVLAEMLRHVPPERLKAIMLSHQDPDIVGGISTWMEMTSSPIYVSKIWTRFLPHYGIRDMSRFVAVPDAGMNCVLARDFELQLVPAHFLHSEGQINVYDPVARILFTGDIGAAMMPSDRDEPYVHDFSAHLPFIEGFHRRYMCSNRAARVWADAVSVMDIQMLAPQHGPVYVGQAVQDFVSWFRELECGVDLITGNGEFRK